MKCLIATFAHYSSSSHISYNPTIVTDRFATRGQITSLQVPILALHLVTHIASTFLFLGWPNFYSFLFAPKIDFFHITPSPNSNRFAQKVEPGSRKESIVMTSC